MIFNRRTLLSVSLFCAGACTQAVHSPPSSQDDVISRTELSTASTLTTYEAVQRLRPMFLRDRGPVSLVNTSAHAQPVVFVDMTMYGDLETLKSLPASRVEQVRFYPGAQATTKFGSVYGGGVIQLTMRTQ